MDEEKKGFVIKDRRAFDKDGKLKENPESMHSSDAKGGENAPKEKRHQGKKGR